MQMWRWRRRRVWFCFCTESKELKYFSNVLDNNDINYTFSKQKETSTIIFYNTICGDGGGVGFGSASAPSLKN